MRLSLFAVLLTLAGCASSPTHDLSKVQAGMDKDEVLQRAGDPKRTFRSNSQDHWVYVYFQGDQEFSQQIDFASGKVVKIGRARSKADLEQALENAQTMEEYEAKAREHQRKSGSGFKDIDGGTARANGE